MEENQKITIKSHGLTHSTEIPWDADIFKMLEAIEKLLKLQGYCFEGEIYIVEKPKNK